MPSIIGAMGPRTILGESPIWDHRSNHLVWVDIDGCQVFRWSWSEDALQVRESPGRPGCIALTSDPDVLLIASEHRIGLLHWPTGKVDWKVHLPIEQASVRLNDGRVSPTGDFWVGSMHVPGSDRRFIGSIYRLRPDWSWEVRVTEVGVANALTAVGDDMLWGDTLHRACWLMSQAQPPGSPPITSASSVALIDFDAIGLPGGPDGACTDAAGHIWLACVHGGALAQLTAEGVLLDRLDLPVRRPTCPAFGGPGLDTLFLTTIGGGGNYPVFDDEPDAGRVIMIDAGVRGVPEQIFQPTRI